MCATGVRCGCRLVLLQTATTRGHSLRDDHRVPGQLPAPQTPLRLQISGAVRERGDAPGPPPRPPQSLLLQDEHRSQGVERTGQPPIVHLVRNKRGRGSYKRHCYPPLTFSINPTCRSFAFGICTETVKEDQLLKHFSIQKKLVNVRNFSPHK